MQKDNVYEREDAVDLLVLLCHKCNFFHLIFTVAARIMKRAASPSILTEVEESTMVVEGVEEVILHDEKRLKTEAEEVCIDEG